MTDAQRLEKIGRLAVPHTYAEDRLGMKLHPTQQNVLKALFRPKSRVVFRCANEVGKTRRVVTAAILYAAEMLGAQVVSTAGVNRQIFEQLIPSLKSYADRYARAEWQFLDRSIKRWDDKKKVWTNVYTGFATDDEHGFQGFHRDEGRPLLIIIDESQAVPDDIFTAAEDRCNPTYFLACGSPGDPQGMFYRMETELYSYYQHFKLTRPECTTDKGWWIEPDDINRMIAKHGQDNPFVQSTIFAEFTTVVAGALISLGEYDRCLVNPPVRSGSDRHAFCDFAAGRDKNVYARRIGNEVTIRKKWADRETMSAVGEFITMFNEDMKECGLTAEEITGDADGLGLPMLQRIQEVGWRINEFHGGSKPRFEEWYRNAVAEAWGEGANKIKRCEIRLPNDPDLKAQILGRKCKRNSSGKLELESKEDMKKRGLSSPDEADAVFGAMMPPNRSQSFNMISSPQVPVWQQQTDDPEHAYSGERRYFT